MIEIWAPVFNEISESSSAYKRMTMVHGLFNQRFTICNKTTQKRFLRKEKTLYDVTLYISYSCHEVVLHGATERQISLYFLGLLNGRYFERENTKNNSPVVSEKRNGYCDRCKEFNGKRYCRTGIGTTIMLNKYKCKYYERSKL